MTWAWSLPVTLVPTRPSLASPLRANATRVVVPTYRDWDDARRTIESLLRCRPRPADIVLVDDNAEDTPPAWVARSPITFVSYRGNRGPAYARNAGACAPSDRRIDWLYFTDGGCERDPGFFGELEAASHLARRGTIAIAAPVAGQVTCPKATPINHYMTVEAILCPPRDLHGPQAIVTANAAVYAPTFRASGGFCTLFPTAAGEDLDLGLRLRSTGWIGWAERAVVRHAFAEDELDFVRRFERYGAGNARLERLWGMSSLRPAPFRAATPELQRLADLQVEAMRRGYDLVKLGSPLDEPSRPVAHPSA
ncbi:MAG: hypothetical protein OHK0013_01570 [Sandaracinaceae bacterium]